MKMKVVGMNEHVSKKRFFILSFFFILCTPQQLNLFAFSNKISINLILTSNENSFDTVEE